MFEHSDDEATTRHFASKSAVHESRASDTVTEQHEGPFAVFVQGAWNGGRWRYLERRVLGGGEGRAVDCSCGGRVCQSVISWFMT